MSQNFRILLEEKLGYDLGLNLKQMRNTFALFRG